MTQINAYDDYGIPQGKSATGALIAGGAATAMFGRFGYTGQAWLPEVGLYHYKNRTYSPTMGRFMQADPIGYGDGVNLYAYVGGDPINFTDPLGLAAENDDISPETIIVNGRREGVGAAPGGNRGLGAGFSFGDRSGGSFVQVGPLGVPAVDDGMGTLTVTAAFKFVSFGRGLGGRGVKSGDGNGCPPPMTPTAAGQIADIAEDVADYADGVAVVSGTLGLFATPTVAGFAIFEGTALIAGSVGRLASGVSIIANLVDGDLAGAGKGAASLIGGSAAGFATKGLLGRSIASGRMFGTLSSSQRRAVNVAGDGVAAGYGRIIGRIGC